jgi:protein required for attachment to host cells
MKNWIVVANAKRARVLEESVADASTGRPRYGHVADLLHPVRRKKGAARGRLVGPAGAGLGSGSCLPRMAPFGSEDDQYALELARLLDEGIAGGRCTGLVLVASHTILGLLKARLGPQASKAVLRTLAADYTMLDEVALAARLAQAPVHAPLFTSPLVLATRG